MIVLGHRKRCNASRGGRRDQRMAHVISAAQSDHWTREMTERLGLTLIPSSRASTASWSTKYSRVPTRCSPRRILLLEADSGTCPMPASLGHVLLPAALVCLRGFGREAGPHKLHRPGGSRDEPKSKPCGERQSQRMGEMDCLPAFARGKVSRNQWATARRLERIRRCSRCGNNLRIPVKARVLAAAHRLAVMAKGSEILSMITK